MAEEPNVKKQKLDESDETRETESEGKNCLQLVSQNKETRQLLYIHNLIQINPRTFHAFLCHVYLPARNEQGHLDHEVLSRLVLDMRRI